jgi:hypothetical protein
MKGLVEELGAERPIEGLGTERLVEGLETERLTRRLGTERLARTLGPRGRELEDEEERLHWHHHIPRVRFRRVRSFHLR